VVEVGAEHDLEVRGVLDREAHVGHAHLQKLPGALLRGGQGVGQQVVALGGEGGQQPGLVSEVMRRRGVRDPRLSGQFAQADAGGAGLGDGLDGGVEHGSAEVAVVVWAGCCHGLRLPQI
jgi:hypothetical protein